MPKRVNPNLAKIHRNYSGEGTRIMSVTNWY